MAQHVCWRLEDSAEFSHTRDTWGRLTAAVGIVIMLPSMTR